MGIDFMKDIVFECLAEGFASGNDPSTLKEIPGKTHIEEIEFRRKDDSSFWFFLKGGDEPSYHCILKYLEVFLYCRGTDPAVGSYI